MFGSFPFEAEPDGAVFGPHHFYLGVLLILLVCWLVADADDGKPWAVAGLTLLAAFSFALTWPYYPVVGAFGTLVLLGCATLLAGLRPYWWRRSLGTHAVLVVGLLVALDDAVSHALGLRTPLDSVWAEYLYPYVSDPWVPSASDLASEVGVHSGVSAPADLPSWFGVWLSPELEAFLLEKLSDAVAMVAL